MASLMIFPDEIMLTIIEYLLNNAKISFDHPRLPFAIAQTPHRPNMLRITAVNNRLRGLSWSYLKRHVQFTALHLENLLHKFSRSTTYEHIENLDTGPDQFRHFLSADIRQPAPILAPFPNLKHVTIWLRKDYRAGKAWRLRTRKGETKTVAFVRHMITKTIGTQLANLLSFLYCPSLAVEVVIEIECTRIGEPVSQILFPICYSTLIDFAGVQSNNQKP